MKTSLFHNDLKRQLKIFPFISFYSNSFLICCHGITAQWSRPGQKSAMSTKIAQRGDFVMSIHVGLVCTLEHPVISLVRRLDVLFYTFFYNYYYHYYILSIVYLASRTVYHVKLQYLK